MKKILLIGILAVVLSTFVSATTDCPCILPGDPGTIVKVKALNGTAENVTFILEDKQPELGGKIQFWALQEREISANQVGFVPIEELNVSILVDSELIDEELTDEKGAIELALDLPGQYRIEGGDGILLFEIEAPEPVVNDTVNDTPVVNDTPPVVVVTPPVNDTPKPPPEKPSGDDNLWLHILILVVAVAAVAVIWTKRKSL